MIGWDKTWVTWPPLLGRETRCSGWISWKMKMQILAGTSKGPWRWRVELSCSVSNNTAVDHQSSCPGESKLGILCVEKGLYSLSLGVVVVVVGLVLVQRKQTNKQKKNLICDKLQPLYCLITSKRAHSLVFCFFCEQVINRCCRLAVVCSCFSTFPASQNISL